jgi:hypothetical protein
MLHGINSTASNGEAPSKTKESSINMTFRTKSTVFVTLAMLAACSLSAAAFPFGKKKPVDDQVFRKLTPAQNALVDKAIVHEAAVIKALKERSPLVDTYIQNMKPDPLLGQVPESDWHSLARVNFGKIIGEEGYSTNPYKEKGSKFGFMKHSLGYITGLSTNHLHLNYQENGFVRMIVIDSQGPNGDGFNRQNYSFLFVRNEFLGTIPTMVIDVKPTKQSAGRFFGRMWIERNGGNIVRYNGDLAGSQLDQKEYYHFDSWRTNVTEGLWLPTSFYAEETDPKSPSHVLQFKAINHVWGYELKIPAAEEDQTSIEVVGADDQTKDAATNDVSPLGAQREWIQQAEDNVIERLYTAGLIDAKSPFDETLAALANNILVYNNIATSRPIRVRTLLTEPLESISIGNTILLSKSLIDTTAIQSVDGAQQAGNLNAVLAFQIAHIILGHHIDTKFAFSDRMMFPAESAFQRLPMHHTDQENVDAAKKAIDLMQTKELVDSQGFFGLYLQQLATRSKALKALNEPMIGDGLMKPDGSFWLQALVSKAPKLAPNDLKQQAAMPLASFLRFDPWTDQVIAMRTTYEPLLSSRDKMPFEITPVYLKLTYWHPAAPPPPAAGDAAATTPPDTTAAPASPPPATAAPATTVPDTTAAPQPTTPPPTTPQPTAAPQN